MPFDNNIKALQTPERVRSLLKLTSIGSYTKEELLNLLQPTSLQANQDTSREVFNFAKAGKLIEEDSNKRIRATISEEAINDPVQFRKTILQHARQNTDLFFHKFTSWAFSRAEEVMVSKPEELEGGFYRDISGKYTGNREYGKTNIAGWVNWVSYLGFGYEHNGFFVANPYVRIKEDLLLDSTLKKDSPLPFALFIQWLSKITPELDGGNYFEQYKPTTPDQHVSFILSAGLRTLHNQGVIRMRIVPDATDVWLLTPSKLHDITQMVSEISIIGGAAR